MKLVQAGGQTVSEIAREFEISTDSVRRWLKQAERDAGSRQAGRQPAPKWSRRRKAATA